jgi:hypothetical protein
VNVTDLRGLWLESRWLMFIREYKVVDNPCRGNEVLTRIELYYLPYKGGDETS